MTRARSSGTTLTNTDLARVFDSLETKTEYFWDTMHPNEKGNALIAASLFRRIRELESAGGL